ncbi:MAG TPA: acetylglutamate kinase [Gemmatimonadaceae bacterium]|nr:acetylglutamate kinase [Gemmatimonadaceae bacterium]
MKSVVKIGGRAQASPMLAPVLAEAWAARPGAMCIVHGGGDEISAMQRRLGSAPGFSGGRRVTSEEDISVVRMVLSGLVNKRLVSQLVAAGISAVGISGEDAGFLEAQALGIEEFGHVGMPGRVSASLIGALLVAGFLPVISPLAKNGGGQGALNVNGDDAAAAIAVATDADELLLVADVAGVIGAEGSALSVLDVQTARALIANGTASNGMAAKLEAAHAALAGGVPSVRIAPLEGILDPSVGTRMTLDASLAA